MNAAVDPILASVFAHRLSAIGEQMGFALMRTARSTLLVEARDFSVAIFRADGVLIHQTEYIPILGYATAPAMKAIVAYFGDDVREGDVILHNDVFSGGNQMADLKVVKPVFFRGELMAWVVINAHQVDIGGATPGGYNPDAREVWQEAIRITPVKVVEAGRRRADVWDFVFANVRLPIVADDVEAAIGGCTIGERALISLIDKYGPEMFDRYAAHLLRVSADMARAEIATWPDGTYRGEAVAVYDGVRSGSRMKICVTATVEGDSLALDFEGTDDQTPGYVNAPESTTVSSVLIALYMLMDQGLPHNEGILDAIDIRIPEGSMLNPRFPAATGYGNHLSDHIVPAVMAALDQVVPERVTAGWAPLMGAVGAYRSPESGELYVNLVIPPAKGGGGGTAGADGFDAIGIVACGGAVASVDPEMWEIEEPHFIRTYEFLTDSGGAGEWRGGLGLKTELEVLWPLDTLSVTGDGEEAGTAAPGIRGGFAGAPNVLELELPDGSRLQPIAKSLVHGLPPRTLWRQRSAGGGGFGDPKQRDRSLVADDVRAGLVSREAAGELYGWEEEGGSM